MVEVVRGSCVCVTLERESLNSGTLPSVSQTPSQSRTAIPSLRIFPFSTSCQNPGRECPCSHNDGCDLRYKLTIQSTRTEAGAWSQLDKGIGRKKKERDREM